MPTAERELFACWAALVAGETMQGSLPVAAIALLAVILEALLRVQEYKAFEVLVPLLQGSQLPVREQRELLATIYLRRGFLQSAAQEWMDVAPSSPTRARAGGACARGAGPRTC